jgi:ethanolamine utilization protein EutM
LDLNTEKRQWGFDVDNRSLGIIETFGLVPAVACADAALKTADVELIGSQYAKNGLVAVFFLGDVSSVKAAVEAGRIAGAYVGRISGSTLIARLGDGLDVLGVTRSRRAVKALDAIAKNVKQAGKNADAGGSPGSDKSLDTMPVIKLRAMARQLEGLPLSREEIRFARKADLIKTINVFLKKMRSND